MLFTMAMVVWISALMKDLYDRALYFILYIHYLSWRPNEALCIAIWFSIMIPSYVVPNWSYLSSSLPPLPIVTWRFIMSPIKVSLYSQSIPLFCWSQWFHFRNQAIMYPPPLSDISYEAGLVKGTVRLVVLTTSPFDHMVPSDNIISASWASSSRNWNIFSHFPRVYNDSRRPSKFLTLDAVAPINTGWKKEEDGIWGTDGSITIHAPSFTNVISFPDPLYRVCDAILN